MTKPSPLPAVKKRSRALPLSPWLGHEQGGLGGADARARAREEGAWRNGPRGRLLNHRSNTDRGGNKERGGSPPNPARPGPGVNPTHLLDGLGQPGLGLTSGLNPPPQPASPAHLEPALALTGTGLPTLPTRTNTNPYDTKAISVGRSGCACGAQKVGVCWGGVGRRGRRRNGLRGVVIANSYSDKEANT
jgi:hypothetical protein